MASFFITGTSTTARSLAAGENGFVAAGATLYTETGPAVEFQAGSAAMTLGVMGTVAAAEGPAAVRSLSSVTTAQITVGAAGAILSTGGDAVRMFAFSRLQLSNDGLVSGDTGIFFGGNALTEVLIQNTGRILSDAPVSVTDPNAAIQIDTGVGVARIVNTGLLQALDVAILSGASVTEIVNTGQIVTTPANDAIRLANGGAVSNSGTITGAVKVSVGPALVQNSGRIEGNVSLGSGNGVFVSAGGQVAGDIRGEAGNDRFVVDSGALVILGGSGVDTIESSVSLRNGVDVEVLLLTGSAGLQAIGRGQDETITGGAGNDTIEGRDGQDRLDGGEGDDILRGGQGNDVLLMSAGDDTLAGGAGRDLLRLDLGTGAVVSLAAGAATSRDAGGEVLRSAALAGIEDVEGSAQADAITGSGGDNLLLGNGGDDTVSGGNGNDRLDGGTGADTLVGGNGVDTLSGGTGADVLTGGAGADRFVFAEVTDSPPGAADRITDFAAATEVIDLEAIYGDENAPVDVPFTFLGTGAFTGNGPEVRYFQNGGITVLEIRYAESVINDMEIVLTGLVNLTAANFIL